MTRMSHLTPPLQHILELLGKAIRKEKESKGIPFGKDKIKLSLSADDVIVYTENNKESMQELLELICDYNKILRYKVNTQNRLFFCIQAMNYWILKLKTLLH